MGTQIRTALKVDVNTPAEKQPYLHVRLPIIQQSFDPKRKLTDIRTAGIPMVIPTAYISYQTYYIYYIYVLA